VWRGCGEREKGGCGGLRMRKCRLDGRGRLVRAVLGYVLVMMFMMNAGEESTICPAKQRRDEL
jgi:hypothetical protein